MESLAVKFNKIFIIQSLKESERGDAGDKLYSTVEEILEYQNDKILTVDLINVYDSKEFFKALRDISNQITEGFYPYLHFEMHGRADGLKLVSGDVLLWTSFRERIQEINIRCRNNLYVSLSTCYGAEFIKLFRSLEPSPFFGYIGPVGDVLFIEALTTYESYFKVLLTKYSFTKAIVELQNCVPENKEKYQAINCLQYFAVYYEMYKEKYGFEDPKQIYQMKKKLLNDLVLQNPGRSKTSLSKYVEHYRFVEREKVFFEETRKNFLHGMDYPDLEIK